MATTESKMATTLPVCCTSCLDRNCTSGFCEKIFFLNKTAQKITQQILLAILMASTSTLFMKVCSQNMLNMSAVKFLTVNTFPPLFGENTP